LQYASRPAPGADQLEAWGNEAKPCKLWGACRGRCSDGDPYPEGHRHAGRSRWLEPIYFPNEAPAGFHRSDRRTNRCPREVVPPWIWTALDLWQAWRSLGGGSIAPGPLYDQPARLVDLFAIFDSEQAVIGLAHREEASA
jgi:hypothetical protein